MGMVENEEIVIVGGGIAGLATAVALKRVGFQARVLERHHELRAGGTALGLAPNAWYALRALGVDSKLTSTHQNFTKTVVTNLETGDTQVMGFPMKKDRGDDIGARYVQRKTLLKALAEELPPDTIRFSSKLISIKSETLQDSSKVTALHLDDGSIIKSKVVIGCDGVHSAVAQWLGLSQPLNSGRSAAYGLAVFPEDHGFEMLVVRMYLGGSVRAGFIPLNSKEVYWFFLHKSSSFEQDISMSPELILKEVTDNLAKDFPSDFLLVAKHTDLSTLAWGPLRFRAPWNVAFGRTQNGNVTVAGDAMHPMTPDIGQGGCSALEDAVILARCLKQAHATATESQCWVENALKRYVDERRWRAACMVAGSWLSGMVQQGGCGDQQWWSRATRWFRDRFLYKFVLPKLVNFVWTDCGDLGSPVAHGAGST
ncbi:FAD/NAD(P)-binding oxidoreductase family protein [Rhynchospora pubera]|uniref:FAD/NAD(P)-binding oxidoreductase family protein n=1 Tax=Rhynchospora pubera TaxID=906938 RepID=A0AAV8D4C2_9POAL|nr:FAD/NAD(P)-binding oxidoreductase family protein [Rhynchospora pubera]